MFLSMAGDILASLVTRSNCVRFLRLKIVYSYRLWTKLDDKLCSLLRGQSESYASMSGSLSLAGKFSNGNVVSI